MSATGVIHAKIAVDASAEQRLRAEIEAGVFAVASRHGTSPPLVAQWIESPIGLMIAIADDHGVHLLEFADAAHVRDTIARLRERLERRLVFGSHAFLSALRTELAQYFANERRAFHVPLALRGTSFQRRAWGYVRTIPFGETRTYRDLARALGNERAVRAAGRANGANPVAVVLPCHRIIGIAGGLAGYGGGVERKRWLLEHERAAE